MGAQLSKTQFERLWWRLYCETLSTGVQLRRPLWQEALHDDALQVNAPLSTLALLHSGRDEQLGAKKLKGGSGP
ncbi:hypothetical protein B5V02_09070 [Mesorhizobium kowhaii]|uniref:Uncharacterized protein n=1 Tax=Mesorhizobium kowhaii TaxID=1300272 RepID=A0A2W7C6K0_9HYPH|nr:hypothetical protein B5V02_09070 [Mesorhizobium kowhaii]